MFTAGVEGKVFIELEGTYEYHLTALDTAGSTKAMLVKVKMQQGLFIALGLNRNMSEGASMYEIGLGWLGNTQSIIRYHFNVNFCYFFLI